MNFERFKKFILENYKLLIPVMLLLIVFLAFIIYYFVSKNFTFSEVTTKSYYQYLGGEKITYDVEVTKNAKGVITKLNPVGRSVEYDSTPLYDSNKDIVIFPKDMSVVVPLINCAEYLTKANSYIKYENKRYSLITDKYNQFLSHYFFYDGHDLYFFIEDVTLVVDKKEIELSPFSYVVVSNNEIIYYDKVSDTMKILDKNSSDVYVKNDYYTVYVGADYIDYYDQRVILTEDVSYLSTIDEMRRIINDE